MANARARQRRCNAVPPRPRSQRHARVRHQRVRRYAPPPALRVLLLPLICFSGVSRPRSQRAFQRFDRTPAQQQRERFHAPEERCAARIAVLRRRAFDMPSTRDENRRREAVL